MNSLILLSSNKARCYLLATTLASVVIGLAACSDNKNKANDDEFETLDGAASQITAGVCLSLQTYACEQQAQGDAGLVTLLNLDCSIHSCQEGVRAAVTASINAWSEVNKYADQPKDQFVLNGYEQVMVKLRPTYGDYADVFTDVVGREDKVMVPLFNNAIVVAEQNQEQQTGSYKATAKATYTAFQSCADASLIGANGNIKQELVAQTLLGKIGSAKLENQTGAEATAVSTESAEQACETAKDIAELTTLGMQCVAAKELLAQKCSAMGMVPEFSGYICNVSAKCVNPQ